jgi:spermidine/putrescine transport system permease protein
MTIGRASLSLTAWLGIGFIYLPIAVMIIFSFNDSEILSFPLSGLTLRWYEELFADRRIVGSIWNSVLVSGVSAAIATVAGTGAAWCLVRTEFRGKGLFRIIVILPLMIPAVMLGLSLLASFVQLHVHRNLMTVVLGYLTFTTSFVTLVVSTSLQAVDPALEDAARDLYASPARVFGRVTLPLIAPGIIAGALFAFTLAFDEYVIAFLNSGTQETLPLVIMGMMRYGLSPKINALATVIYAASFILIVLATLLLLRTRKRAL